MKLLLCAAFALSLMAQNAKIDPKSVPPESENAKHERLLTESESLRFQLLSAKMQLLNDQYKIPEYQRDFAPLATEQQALMLELCKSVGVPADEIQKSCAVDLGLGQDGKPRNGPDGKPVAAKVWKAVPAPTPASIPSSR